MAGTYTFHNKFHRANHHTLGTTDQLDSGLDPIATKEYPFYGVFYNLITDAERTFNIETNSYNWWSVYTTVLSNSSNWMLTRSVYSTVSSLSDNWNLGYQGYTTLKAYSGDWDNSYTIISSFSADWGSPYLMFTNVPQVYTHSKTFSGQDLRLAQLVDQLTGEVTDLPGLSTYEWNLDRQQVGYATLEKNMFLSNPDPDTMVDGGIYTLVVTQNNPSVVNSGYDLEFDKLYRFNSVQTFNNVVNTTLSGITIINFICVNGFMLGDVTKLAGNFTV